MCKRKRKIRNAILSKGIYESKETNQKWIVIKVNGSKGYGQNYEIRHQHPNRKIHFQEYAYSAESAIKKILKHEEWTIRKS